MTETQPPVNKKKSWARRVLKTILYLFIASLLYVVVCRFVYPPVTITQLGALFGGYGLKRDYVSWEEISPNVKLAAMASEDQLFPDHDGFDWKAIDKSLNGKPSKRKHVRTRGSAASTI